ncbi:MAG: STAS domain-containing protein [Nitrospira sp.]|nr:STAS domain-containing protein [Nitrospira sp.]
MELRVLKIDSNLTHLALVGRLDLPGVQSIEATFVELTEGRGKPTLVDLSELTFLGSSGIRVFLKAAKGLNKLGSKIVLLNPQPQVKDTLMYVEFGRLIPIEHDSERALEILKS